MCCAPASAYRGGRLVTITEQELRTLRRLLALDREQRLFAIRQQAWQATEREASWRGFDAFRLSPRMADLLPVRSIAAGDGHKHNTVCCAIREAIYDGVLDWGRFPDLRGGPDRRGSLPLAGRPCRAVARARIESKRSPYVLKFAAGVTGRENLADPSLLDVQRRILLVAALVRVGRA